MKKSCLTCEFSRITDQDFLCTNRAVGGYNWDKEKGGYDFDFPFTIPGTKVDDMLMIDSAIALASESFQVGESHA